MRPVVKPLLMSPSVNNKQHTNMKTITLNSLATSFISRLEGVECESTEKKYKILWFRRDGSVKTFTNDFLPIEGSMGGEGFWGDEHTQEVFTDPREWFLANRERYHEEGEPEARLVERPICQWRLAAF
jgi:hypothetical protein